MKNIHILPTDKPSRLVLDDTTQQLILINKGEALWGNRNIYITSNEEIKEGDWVYCLREGFEPVLKQKVNPIGVNNDEMMKKIILTTDQDLIKDGVQAIDDEFLEWFVKNPSCEWVEAKLIEEIPSGFTFGMFGNDEPPTELVYKIIIPKEEPKQETLEEAAKEFANNSAVTNYEEGINVGKYQGFINGAKWQTERMYSEEEVRKIAEDAYSMGKNNILIGVFNKWFEQFKKK